MVAIDVARSESEACAGAPKGTGALVDKSLPWNIVWCHERCHKSECDQRRTAITKEATQVGASLVCLKKAGKFASWLSHGNCAPYVLLTDWREVKPCVQLLSEGATNASRRPSLIVVLAESPQHFERSSAWAQSLPFGADPVIVVRDLEPLDAFVNMLVSRLQCDSTLSACNHGMTEEKEQPQKMKKAPGSWVLQPKSLLRTSQRIASSFMPLGTFPCFDACFQLALEYQQKPFQQICNSHDSAPVLATMPVKQANFVGGDFGQSRAYPVEPACNFTLGGDSVADIISPVCATRNMFEIEQLLKEAMPDHYDE